MIRVRRFPSHWLHLRLGQSSIRTINTIAPSLENDSKQSINLSKPSPRSTNILHRTPWQPPVAESAQGIYVTLVDSTHLIDAVGGAAVTCIGNGHPKVTQAIKDQLDKVSCTRVQFFATHTIPDCTITDVYNMQLSNQPAEALAKKLVDTSGGAFKLCGFASGGLILFAQIDTAILTILPRIGGYGRRFKVGQTGTLFI